METMRLPVGIENFEKIRTMGYYYVDKTDLIRELLDSLSEANLFLRPRRFGKSLNMNMLKCFFEYGSDPALFKGLRIAKEKELCEKYMGQYPVISLTLKMVDGCDYDRARGMLCTAIGNIAMQFQFLSKSSKLSAMEKDLYRQLTTSGGPGGAPFVMTDETLADSLRTLCELLFKHYGKRAILLIDEYDVPLDRAQHHGYYDEMAALIRALFGQALKSNAHLEFAILTGCLRIAKESIFTGLNNLQVFSIANVRFAEHFGFSETEVQAMLAYYGREDKYELIKAWYDGYHFGDMDIYCPWDVVSYVEQLRVDPKAHPEAFWVNTSGNDIVRALLQQATRQMRQDLETLVNGGYVSKKINPALTYRDLYRSTDNLWSVLFMTGYLTLRARPDGNFCELMILNLEIREIFVDQIMERFREDVRQDAPGLEAGCKAALAQIERIGYEERLRQDDMVRVIKYGIACHRKSCKVTVEGDEPKQ